MLQAPDEQPSLLPLISPDAYPNVLPVAAQADSAREESGIAMKALPVEMTVGEANQRSLPSFLPTKATFLSDVRVVIPEGFTAGTGSDGYLDIMEHPMSLAELQRTGLFLLTQLSEAMAAHRKLTDLQKKYDDLAKLAGEAEQQLRQAKVIYAELVNARDHWKQSYEDERTQHRLIASAMETTQEKAKLDHDMLVLTEAEVDRLQADLKTFETMMQPFLGGRKVAEVLQEYRDQQAAAVAALPRY